jgi:hypothetical protein
MPPRRATANHEGRYRNLWEHLRSATEPRIQMSFGEVERVLGFPLPPSCRFHQAHWYGYEGSAVARAIADAGWKAQGVDLVRERVTLVRVTDARNE